MRCRGCPYKLHYCDCRIFGDSDYYIYENQKGELGCKYNRRTLQKFERIQKLEEEEIIRQMGDFAEFCKKEKL